MQKKLIILDRDGVINFDSDDYIKSPEEWVSIPGSLEAISDLNQRGYHVAVATNQSGIGRGFFTQDTLLSIHEKMRSDLAHLQGSIDYIAYCPHHPDANCPCRKPKIGLLLEISEALHISLQEAYFVGDTFKDMQAASNALCQGILVKTGKGSATLEKYPTLANQYPVYENLEAFVRAL